MKVIFEIDQPTVQKAVMSQLETGVINAKTADAITNRYQALSYETATQMTQYPGYPLSVGSRDVRN